MTLIQAQERYIARVNNCHPGHRGRVSRSASREFYAWATKKGYAKTDISILLNDAIDMAKLQRDSED